MTEEQALLQATKILALQKGIGFTEKTEHLVLILIRAIRGEVLSDLNLHLEDKMSFSELYQKYKD